MFTHRSPSPPSSSWHAYSLSRAGFGRFGTARIPALLYDVLLLFLVILTLMHHVLGLGFLLAAFLVWRSIGRSFARSRLTASASSGPRCEQRR
ncbi:hypothetical protein [Streptomyces sp. NPDC046985]|uniref:hypothetical protein n=1 Tax=Streptomyces sp. NPDC046985 TaxID=3155377 RepID=UPI0033F10902